MNLTNNEKLYILQMLKERKEMLEEHINFELEKDTEINNKNWSELLLIYNILEKRIWY